MWRFATSPPVTGATWTNDAGETEALEPLQDCPPLRYGMVNAELLVAYRLCLVARDDAAARVDLWESWAETEDEAHARLSGQ